MGFGRAEVEGRGDGRRESRNAVDRVVQLVKLMVMPIFFMHCVALMVYIYFDERHGQRTSKPIN